MIIIKLQGGLGNQMFQYAFASVLANKNEVLIKLDTNFFDLAEKGAGFTPRNFELNIFNNSYCIATEQEIFSLLYLSIPKKIIKKLGFKNSKIYNEPSLDFQWDALSIKAPVYLNGYFQSYKYLSGFENLVREIFSFPVDRLDDVNEKIMVAIKNSISISIHVRRGDYVSDGFTQQFHGNCSLEYYSNAISLLASNNVDFTLIFFSDDCEWVKEQFKNLTYSKMFIDHNDGENSWKDMLLMSSCTHNIIANSSFSWWAAWLNDNPKKTIIAPKNWYADTKLNTDDLIPPQWIRI
jgi:hypothetical protein